MQQNVYKIILNIFMLYVQHAPIKTIRWE